MANLFIDFLTDKIRENPFILTDLEKAGERARIYDNLQAGLDDLGPEGRKLLAESEALFAAQTLHHPYTQTKLELIHDRLMGLNQDIEQSHEWNAFFTSHQDKFSSLSELQKNIIQNQLMAAYRFKVISLFTQQLNLAHQDQQLLIQSQISGILQTANICLKDDKTGTTIAKTEFYKAVIDYKKNELRELFRANFNETQTNKLERIVNEIGTHALAEIFEYYAHKNTSLTHQDSRFRNLDHFTKFISFIQNKYQSDETVRAWIKRDPRAYFFLLRTQEALSSSKDKSLKKFLKEALDGHPKSPAAIKTELKTIIKQLDKTHKPPISDIIKNLDKMDNYDDMIVAMKNIKTQAETLKMNASTDQSAILRFLSKTCEEYIKTQYVPPLASISSGLSSTSSSSSSLGTPSPTRPLTPLKSTLAATSTKPTGVAHKQDIVTALRAFASDVLIRDVSELISQTADQVEAIDNAQQIEQALDQLKTDIKRQANRATDTQNADPIIKQIEQIEQIFKGKGPSSSPKP